MRHSLVLKSVDRSLRAHSAMLLMPSASHQPYRRVIYNGFSAENVGASGTSHHRSRPRLSVVSLNMPLEEGLLDQLVRSRE